jgi:NADP-dependent 3-hydroxy acid dehydrogenase YdfG
LNTRSPHSVPLGTTSQHEYAVNTQPFAGKVIAVTGASRGLGLALAKYLLPRGAIVSMCATSEKNLANAVSEIEDLNFPDVKEW